MTLRKKHKKDLTEILVNKIFVYLLIFLFLNNCSFQSKSKFWTKEKNIKQEIKKNNKRDLFVLENIAQKEFNPGLKIRLEKIKPNFDKNNKNNDSIADYVGSLKKISKFKFSKIKYFEQYEPEIIFEKDNIIFFDNKGSIVKFDKNSNLIWKKNYYSKEEKKKNPFLFFSRSKNVLIVVDTISKYYAIDVDNGNLLWSHFNNAPFISDVKIEKDKIFVVDSNNILKCFSLKDGKLIWEHKSDTSKIKSSKKISIAITDNKVLFSNSIGDINAIDVNNGKLIWLTPTANKQSLIQPYLLKISDLVINDKSVVFSNNNNEFFSIDLNSGFINWKQKINSYIRPVIVHDFIFTITLDGYLVVINNLSGNIIRTTNVFGKLSKKSRDLNLFKSKKMNPLYIFDTLEKKENKKQIKSEFKPVGLLIGQKDIFVSTSHGKLFIVNILNGKTKSILNIDKDKISRPFFSNKNLYLIKEDSIIKLN